MNSNKNLIIGAIVLVAIVLIGWLVLRDHSGDSLDTATATPSSSASPTARPSASASTTPKAVIHTVQLTAQGVTPKTLTIRVGDAVTFTNMTSTRWWPASDPHPTHTLCPGFDADRGLGYKESYTLTFATARTCTYHNHLDATNPADQGTIIIQ